MLSPYGIESGLPEGRWISKELLYNAPSQSLIAVLDYPEGEWHELKAYVRRLDEPQYRPILSPEPEIDLHYFTVSPDRKVAYAIGMRRHVSPKYERIDGKLTQVEGKLERGHDWEAVFRISLPDGQLTRLGSPEGFRPRPQHDWISRIMGAGPGGLLYVTIGITSPLKSEELREGAKSGQRLDYYLAEYETDSGAIRRVSLLMSPFY